MQQKALSGIPLPAVRTVQSADQLVRGHLVEPGDLARFRAGRKDAVNTAHVMAGAEIEPLLNLFWNPLWVLDHLAVHVRNVKRSIRAGLEHGGTKPIIRGGEKFVRGVIVGAMT